MGIPNQNKLEFKKMTKKMSSKAARRIQSSQDKKGNQKDKSFISRASKAANKSKK